MRGSLYLKSLCLIGTALAFNGCYSVNIRTIFIQEIIPGGGIITLPMSIDLDGSITALRQAIALHKHLPALPVAHWTIIWAGQTLENHEALYIQQHANINGDVALANLNIENATTIFLLHH